mmetsp:Transcript_57725/g.137367  ORF Transcript_57725/g.137367 Transcript_57725/m.137367 type:complete len:205 (+) Transcript_57725:2031-2645(+)
MLGPFIASANIRNPRMAPSTSTSSRTLMARMSSGSSATRHVTTSSRKLKETLLSFCDRMMSWSCACCPMHMRRIILITSIRGMSEDPSDGSVTSPRGRPAASLAAISASNCLILRFCDLSAATLAFRTWLICTKKLWEDGCVKFRARRSCAVTLPFSKRVTASISAASVVSSPSGSCWTSSKTDTRRSTPPSFASRDWSETKWG